MKLYIKQKVFSFRDKFHIFDENGEVKYTATGEILTLGKKLHVTDAYDREQQAGLDKLPKCAYCGEPSQDDYCWEIDDEIICEDCLNDHYRRYTENYID